MMPNLPNLPNLPNPVRCTPAPTTPSTPPQPPFSPSLPFAHQSSAFPLPFLPNSSAKACRPRGGSRDLVCHRWQAFVSWCHVVRCHVARRLVVPRGDELPQRAVGQHIAVETHAVEVAARLHVHHQEARRAGRRDARALKVPAMQQLCRASDLLSAKGRQKMNIKCMTR